MMNRPVMAGYNVVGNQLILQKLALEKEIYDIILDAEDGFIPKEKYPEYEERLLLLMDELHQLSEKNPWLKSVKGYDPDIDEDSDNT